MTATQGNDNTIGIYFKKEPQNNPDTDSIEIDLSSQETNITPDVRYRHARMYYKWGLRTNVPNNIDITFNAIKNWSDDSLFTLLIDNSNSSQDLRFTFGLEYSFLDDNPFQSRVLLVAAASRVQLYMSLISGKIYVKKSINSDPLVYG